jgi:tetratricopeptide (TPR) repeat protein
MKSVFIVIISGILFTGCGGFMDVKPDKALVVPENLTDMQNLLDNTSVMNEFPALGVIAAEDYHLQPSGINSLRNIVERNTYLWNQDLYEGTTSCSDWDVPYKQIFYANVVLEGLSKIQPKASEQIQWDNLSGSAYFFRAWAFYNLVQFFSDPYDTKTASVSLGVPLKLEADVNKIHQRATVEEVYSQIVQDLTKALNLLPDKSQYPFRPDKVAANAMLARVFHTMGNYEEALNYANICLSLKDDLIDYNTLDPTIARPLPRAILGQNNEVIFYSRLINSLFFFSGVLFPDSSLTDLYHKNDLRKSLFFHPVNSRYIGSYTGDSRLFSGLAVDEIMLIRAECYARLNQEENAVNDLNRLLINRFKKDTYVPLQLKDNEELIRLILKERRKQLFSRGLRWIDLRRINEDSRFADTLHRKLEKEEIVIYPNDRRYIFTIPPNEIIVSGIEQNRR